MTTTPGGARTGGEVDWRVHDYCRKNMSAYWFGYFLPEWRCRVWMLFCYCFKAIDNMTDILPPVRAKSEMGRLRGLIRDALSGRPAAFRSDADRFLYELFETARSDRRVLSLLMRAWAAQGRDSARGTFVSARKLERIRRGKATEIMKLWIYLADPRLPKATVEKIGRKLGLCGQYLDDLLDLEEDFGMKKSTITVEQAKKYGIRTVDDVYESGLANELFERAAKMHAGSLFEITKIRDPLTRLFLLTFAVRFDPRDLKFGRGGRAEKGGTNILKKVLNSLSRVYPRGYLPGHVLAYLMGIPILMAVLVLKGYAKYLLLA